MSRERLDEIVRRQMPDAEKRRRADYVVPTGLGKRASRAALARILRKLKHR
jgi:dephospho-CoA kinase